MNWDGLTVGYALSGSHCTLEEIMPQIQRFIDAGANVIPIVSNTLLTIDTRFGTAEKWRSELTRITGNEIISTIVQAEPLGPSKKIDVLTIAPCTGNTTSRLANAITDSAVLMAAKSQMRNSRPIVIAISTNDGLGLNAANIAKLLVTKNIYFVPFGQDDPINKPNSLVARMDLIMDACESALQGQQLQPMLIERH
ncbi:dipicolinate synthase subunit B [Paenibacillus endoradicis]|uniref:dipicolinate synthase subunit B n=1 Tax=Paenibacillus endoradicis TaxID=2972487 RepID=UPI0021595282|nr:dipicolinate synthase subunit B [Paenibacillus endoradicis]MCR8656309.1 dipicolinate synthase subunit B [Paenibacillus endoradicis]